MIAFSVTDDFPHGFICQIAAAIQFRGTKLLKILWTDSWSGFRVYSPSMCVWLLCMMAAATDWWSSQSSGLNSRVST